MILSDIFLLGRNPIYASLITIEITFCCLDARILETVLQRTVQHTIGLYYFIVTGSLVFGTSIIAMQFMALYSFPVLKNSFTAKITSSLIICQVFLQKYALQPPILGICHYQQSLNHLVFMPLSPLHTMLLVESSSIQSLSSWLFC